MDNYNNNIMKKLIINIPFLGAFVAVLYTCYSMYFDIGKPVNSVIDWETIFTFFLISTFFFCTGRMSKNTEPLIKIRIKGKKEVQND